MTLLHHSSTVAWVPYAADERRAVVLDALRELRTRRAPAWWLAKRTGLGSQAVGAALRGLCARGLVVKVHTQQWDRKFGWWEAT